MARARLRIKERGVDDFVFQISKDEYLDLLFEDLELPRLQKTQLNQLMEMKTYRAGYTSNGVPANINVVRSLQNSLARRMALQAGKKRQLRELEERLAQLACEPNDHFAEMAQLEKRSGLKRRIDAVPFIDTFDLKFNNFVKRPVPSSQAVMFCLMDVSGSMDQATKEMAKRFYILLYLFPEPDLQECRGGLHPPPHPGQGGGRARVLLPQETGGTIVSSALKMMNDIINERYPANQWNIYAAQASDGDNWADDSPQCRRS